MGRLPVQGHPVMCAGHISLEMTPRTPSTGLPEPHLRLRVVCRQVGENLRQDRSGVTGPTLHQRLEAGQEAAHVHRAGSLRTPISEFRVYHLVHRNINPKKRLLEALSPQINGLDEPKTAG